MTDRLAHLTATRTVAIGAVWNIFGRVGPLLVAIAATPFLVRALGVDRWGIFTLALSLIGVFGIFDFGFGRALTRLVSERLATGDEAQAATPVITGIVVLAILGVLGGLVMAALARHYTTQWLHLPESLQHEVLLGLYVLCASAPLVVLNAALWGVLSAYQRFGTANLVNTPIMALYYLGPLAVLPFADNLAAVMLVLVFCRAVMTWCYWRICLNAMPSLRQGRFRFASVLPVLRFGGWLTVSNITWPLLLYMDRFVIAAVLSTAATAYYATPFDLIVRFTIVPLAIMQTAFPAITASYRTAPQKAARLFRLGSLTVAVVLFPAAFIVVMFAQDLLQLWLGKDFAAHAAGVLHLLGVGVLFLCADSVPTGLLDGIGRPDLNAKLSVVSILVYVPVLIGLLRVLGIEGAALAWTLRVILAYALRLLLCARHFPIVVPDLRRLGPALVAALAALIAPLPLATALALAFATIIWTMTLSQTERGYVRARLRLAQ
jgi:O-antigen/teichoic acid export membrane protein